MTLNDIIVAALAQLDRGHDAQSLDTWRDKFTGFVNNAVLDLAEVYRPRHTEQAQLTSGLLNVSTLSHDCVRVYQVVKNGLALPFYSEGPRSIRVDTEDGEISVTYRYAPAPLSSPTDTPELPEYMHGLVVCYVVARERAAGDTSVQRGSNIYFQMYEAGKARIRPHLGDAESFRILNRW